MTRSFFIKNLFGAVIGVALLPTALTSTITPTIKDIEPCDVLYLDLERFRVGNIIRTIKDDYLIISINGIDKNNMTAIARNLFYGNDDIKIIHSKKANHLVSRLGQMMITS